MMNKLYVLSQDDCENGIVVSEENYYETLDILMEGLDGDSGMNLTTSIITKVEVHVLRATEDMFLLAAQKIERGEV